MISVSQFLFICAGPFLGFIHVVALVFRYVFISLDLESLCPQVIKAQEYWCASAEQVQHQEHPLHLLSSRRIFRSCTVPMSHSRTPDLIQLAYFTLLVMFCLLNYLIFQLNMQ